MNEINKIDNVNHPKHYEGHTSLECIQVMEVIMGFEPVVHFCLCNAFKYLWRYKNKNDEEDIKKTRWYLDWVKDKLIEKECTESYLGVMYSRLEDLYLKIEVKE